MELIIVLMVMGILAGAAAPSYFASMEAFYLDAATKRVAADLRYARREARSSAATASVDFHVGDDRYDTTGVRHLRRRDGDYNVDLSEEGYPVTIASTTFLSDMVTFDIHGSPDQAGNVVLQTGSLTRQIVVTQTGNIRIID